MKLYPDKLAAHLARGPLAPVWLIAGDEPLQVGEAADAVRAAARREGYASREVFFVERGFDWQSLRAAGESLSLFAEKRLLELRLPNGKPGDNGAKVLTEFAARPPEDTVLLVVSGKVDKKNKWVGALEKAGVLVEAWPIDAAALPRWIADRMAGAGLAADREAAQLLADRVEGNLLAAAQEIDKLALLVEGNRADADAVREAVADSARFDIFQLADAALAADAVRALRMLDALRAEGAEAVLVVWALAREIRMLAEMAFKVAGGQSPERVSAGVWPKKRQPVVARALQRLPVKAWERLLLEVALIDRQVKGMRRGDAWRNIERLVAAMAGKPLARSPAGTARKTG
ncbi:MAG TPA: DNA polymerase III subunit delta [Gammaproteobacteria bacterium]